MSCDGCSYKAQCCQDNKFFQADSYIEERFYELCMQKNVRNKLLFDWVDNKGTYIAYTDFSRSDEGNYSKHDHTHSVAILNAIVSVLGKQKIDRLNATDLWMILHCAYGHDVGMPYSFTQMEEYWTKISGDTEFGKFFRDALNSEDADLKKATQYINGISRKLNSELLNGSLKRNDTVKIGTEWPAKVYRYVSYIITEFVRTNHAKRSKEMIEDCKLFSGQRRTQIDSRLYKYIAQCCYMHALNNCEDVLRLLPETENDIETEHCHPRFVAYMLRLGDLLDISNNRFAIADLIHYGKLPYKSELHKKKHEAIEHINFTDRTIEITARSDNEEVCQITNDWFSWIKSEVRFLISHWTEFAPHEIGGCTLSEPNTKVYLNDEIFYRIEDCEFHVDKDTLIDLVIGRNLYKTKFDFMKEYIQNALDATKMKFWIDIQNGNLELFINDETKKRKKNRGKVLPFDFENIVFKQYALEVVCDYREKESSEQKNVKEGMVHIEIIDKGIGIDKECVDAISNIGSGWKRRKRYTEYLDIMPKWLKPTGGFGIGMQSGFMITDEIQIESRCEHDVKGRKIGLYSEKKNGRIEERDYPVNVTGTKIEVDIPYDWFMDVENYKEYANLRFIIDSIDFMEPSRTIERVTDFIELYLKTILGNPLFPVCVRQKGRKSRIIEGFFGATEKKGEIFETEHRKYMIFQEPDQDIMLIWDVEMEILCRIELSDKSGVEMVQEWYYKGVRVWTEHQEDSTTELYRYIGNFKIDIMGQSVKDCLTIDRNCFKGGFDYNEISNRFARVCLSFLIRTERVLLRPLTGRKFIRCIAAYKYISDSEKQLMRGYLNAISQEDLDGLLERDDMLIYGYQYESTQDSLEKKEACTLNDVCRDLYLRNCIVWGKFIDISIIPDAVNRLEDLRIWEMSDDKSNGIITLLEDMLLKLYAPLGVKRGNSYVECYNEKAKADSAHISEKDAFVIKMGQRQIYVNNEDYFEPLHVSKIPFYTEEQLEKLRKDGENFIISPVPAIYSDNDSLFTLKNVDDPEETYFKRITESTTYPNLIEWVFQHQKIPNKYNREEIEEEYNKLVRFIFSNYIKTLLEKLGK